MTTAEAAARELVQAVKAGASPVRTALGLRQAGVSDREMRQAMTLAAVELGYTDTLVFLPCSEVVQ